MNVNVPTDRHQWFRSRMAAFATGVLVDDEERAFVEHRDTCEDCRRVLERFMLDAATAEEPAAHIPSAVLAQWERARRELRGIEREMVREHLKHCEECRDDLLRLGHTPELEVVGEVGQTGERHRNWAAWAAGAWAAAATLIVAVLVLNPGLRMPGVRSVLPPSPLPPAPAERAYTLEPLVAARLHTTRRGIGNDGTTIAITSGARFVRLDVGPLDVPEGETLAAEVLMGDSLLLRRSLKREGALEIVFGDANASLSPGLYRLRLVAAPGSGASSLPDTVELPFRLEHAGH